MLQSTAGPVMSTDVPAFTASIPPIFRIHFEVGDFSCEFWGEGRVKINGSSIHCIVQ